jgi:hypothetical protein
MQAKLIGSMCFISACQPRNSIYENTNFFEGQLAAGAPQGGDIPYGYDVTVRYGGGVAPVSRSEADVDAVHAG